MSQIVPLGKSSITLPLLTKDAGAALVDADSIPTVLNVQKNGSDADEAAVTITQAQDSTPANITGNYLVTVDLGASGLNVVNGDQIIVTVNAIVSSTTLTASFTFIVADMAGNVPSIDLG